MNKLVKLITALIITTLVGCASPGKVDMPYVKSHDIPQMEQKRISYDITYQAPEYGTFVDGEMLPPMHISKARLNGDTRIILNNFSQILASQIPSNAVVINSGTGDYKLSLHIKAYDAEGPVVIENLFAETLLKETLTLGMASNEQEIVANFEITYSLFDNNGTKVISKTYKVTDSVDHEKSDYEVADINGKRLTGDLFKKHVTLTLNEFVEETAKLKKENS